MRVWLTGGGGFVGSNIVAAALASGHQVLTTANTFRPPADAVYAVESVDITDRDAVVASVVGFGPDLVIHNAILNDWQQMYADRRLAWKSYVESTRHVVAAASAVDAPGVLVSTDWVFDGTQIGADELTPPNPVNLYGVLKMASEMVALDAGWAVGRVSGVQGMHLARPATPRAQDRGYGYLVASLVDALHAGSAFTVWEADEINMRASPSYAFECAELMLAIGGRALAGPFHLCGADRVTRRELAQMTCAVFGLDPALLRFGPPDPDSNANASIPFDSSLSTPRTDELLTRSATPLRELLERFAADRQGRTGQVTEPATTTASTIPNPNPASFTPTAARTP